MAVWSNENIMLTQKGQELLSKVQVGQGQLRITRVMTGSGRVAKTSLFSQGEVSIPEQEMTISKVTTMESGSNIELRVNNQNLSEPYEVNQIGVYAHHPDMGEILYMIAQCDENTSDTMPLPSITPVTMNFMFYIIHGKSTSLDITVDDAGVVSSATFDEHLEEFRSLCNFVGYTIDDSDVYGVEVDYEAGTCKRIGASVGLSPENFDDISPWGGRRKCIVTNEGDVLAYFGDMMYTELGQTFIEMLNKDGSKSYPTGTPVQVMVEQPKFWYRVVPVKVEKSSNVEGYSLCKARYYISPTPKSGFKLFPLFERGNPAKTVDYAYLPAFLGSVYDVSSKNPAMYDLELEGVISVGRPDTINIILDGFKKYPVDISNCYDAEDVAQAIASVQYDEWTAKAYTVDGYNTGGVSFTCTESGLRQPVEFDDDGESGLVPTVMEGRTSGNGGYAKYDPSGYTFSEDLFCSVSGVKPASGWHNILTQDDVIIMCKNRNKDSEGKSRFSAGFGWQIRDIVANHCTAWLHLIEYASFDCKETIGRGFINTPVIDTDINPCPLNGGDGASERLGNKSGTSDSGQVYYRGEENAWGGLNTYEGGIRVGESEAQICTNGVYSDVSNFGYKIELPKTYGYINRFHYHKEYDWAFLPSLTEGANNRPPNSYFYPQSELISTTSVKYGQPFSPFSGGLVSRDVSMMATTQSNVLGGAILFIPEPK